MSLVIYIAVMAGVTYLIRMIPFAAFRRQIKSRFFRSFLYYVPYARPVELCGGLIGIRLEKGKNSIVMNYMPPYFRVSFWFSLVMLAMGLYFTLKIEHEAARRRKVRMAFRAVEMKLSRMAADDPDEEDGKDNSETDGAANQADPGIIRSKNQIICLRSLAWTVAQLMYESGRDLRDVTEQDIYRANDIVEQCDRNNYKKSGAFPTLCSMPLDEGMYIPAYQEYIFFAQELMPEVRLASLFSLQQELADIAPMMKAVYEILKSKRRDGPLQPGTVLTDALCAWSAFCFASVDSFEVVAGPSAYSFAQIKR